MSTQFSDDSNNQNDFSDKRIGVYSYFAIRCGINFEVGYSREQIINWLGFKRNRNINGIDKQIDGIIKQLETDKYLNCDTEIHHNKFSKVTLDKYKLYPDNQFALINSDELYKIIDFKNYISKTDRMTSSILLLVLSYIKLNLSNRAENQSIKDKPEMACGFLKYIAKEISLSDRKMENAVKMLNQLDIIYSEELPRYKNDEGEWRSNRTIFVNKYKYKNGNKVKDYNYKEELEYGKKFIVNGFKSENEIIKQKRNK